MAEERPGGEGPETISYLKEAFTNQYNWIALVGAAAFSLLSASPLPLLLAGGLELMYLSIVPNTARYQRLVRSRKSAESRRSSEARLGAMAVSLTPDMRRRYETLRSVCAAIRVNYAQLSSTSQIFVGQMEDRLQGLLSSFLRLLAAAQQHREYSRTMDAQAIGRELSQLQNAVASDPPKVQEINRKRIEILQKRLEKYQKIRENQQVIDAQCSAIEDVLALIGDQSVTMRDPQQVSDQLGTLVRDVEQTEETVRQVEAIFDMASPEIGPAAAPPLAGPSATSGARGETKRPIRN